MKNLGSVLCAQAVTGGLPEFNLLRHESGCCCRQLPTYRGRVPRHMAERGVLILPKTGKGGGGEGNRKEGGHHKSKKRRSSE